MGAGVLGLPYAFSYLGWAGGLLLLLLAGGVSLYTSALMAALHDLNGVRHNRYRDLGEAIIGRHNSLLFIAPFQFIVMVRVRMRRRCSICDAALTAEPRRWVWASPTS